jgi:O-antigen ligase
MNIAPVLNAWGSLRAVRLSSWLLLSLTMFLALFLGLLIGLFAAQFSLFVSVILLGLLSLVVMAYMPPLQSIPNRLLLWGLTCTLALYFIWPRNVFIPIGFLPVKHPQRLLYLGVIACALYVVLKCAPARQRLARALQALPLLTGLWAALAAWQFVSLLASEFPLALFGGWFVEFLVVTSVYPLALLCLADTRDLKRLLWALLAAAFLNVLFAVPESLLKRNLFEPFISLGNLDPETARQFLAAKFRGGQYRAQAAFDHPLLYAEFLAVCLPVAGAFALQRGRLGWLAAGLVPLLLAGLYLSHSRVAIVATLLVGVAMFGAVVVRGAQAGRRNPWPLVAALFAVPLVAIAAFLASNVVRDVTAGRSHDESSSTSARLQMLDTGVKRIAEQPLFGYGPRMAAVTLNFQNTSGVLTLDNYLLALTLESGVPALLLYLAVLVLAAWRALRYAVSETDVDLARLALGIFGAMAAFGPIKLVLGTALNNALLPVLMAGLALLVLAPHAKFELPMKKIAR